MIHFLVSRRKVNVNEWSAWYGTYSLVHLVDAVDIISILFYHGLFLDEEVHLLFTQLIKGIGGFAIFILIMITAIFTQRPF